MTTTTDNNVYEAFSNALGEVAKHKSQQRSIEEYLVENHKMARGSFQELIANPSKIENLDLVELSVFVNATHTVTQDDNIKPSNFYKPRDIKKIESYEFAAIDDSSTLPLTIDGVIKVNEENYLTAISYKNLAKWYVDNIITYNFKTQRLSKKSVSKRTGQIKETPDIKKPSVRNIKKLMLEGKYEPSTIIINVLLDGQSEISYEEGQLTIHEGSTVNIIDGAHRLEAVVGVMEERPDFEGYLNVDIKHFPLEKAQYLLAITNTTNRFDKTLVKFYSAETMGQKIAKHLMSIDALKNRIETKTGLTKGITITNFAIVSEAIDAIFAPETPKDRYDAQEVLVKFFDYFMAVYDEQLIKNREVELKTSWFAHHNLFVGFIAIAKKLYDKYGKDFPVDEITKIISGIDFNKETSPLTNYMGGKGKVNSNKVKVDIRDFIEKETDRLLN